MNKKDKFIFEIKKELEIEKEILEKEIYRQKVKINKTDLKIKNIKNNIDESYSILSASQTNNEFENNEINSLIEIIQNSEIETKKLEDKMQTINDKLSKIDNLDENNTDFKFDKGDVINKLQLIYKLVNVDPERCKEEINLLIEKIN